MRQLILLIALTSLFQKATSQDVTFTFINAQNTNDGTFDYYEADIQIASTAGFSLASGLLYINYNTNAFGNNVHANGNLTVTHPTNYVVGSQTFGTNNYKDFVVNDNSDSRFGFSFQANLPEAFIGTNITSTAANLIHIKIKYQNVAQDPSICFESTPPLDDQFYTGGGAQITEDNFDCSGASLPALPVELLSFRATGQEDQTRLDWSTATELNNAGFKVERLAATGDWEMLGFVEGVGTTNDLTDYVFYDENPKEGINYYRLKQIDFDGKYEYSNIVSVLFERSGTVYNMYPNPASNDRVFLEIPETNTTVTLLDNHGRIILENLFDQGVNELPLKQISAGIYYVKFVNGHRSETKRLVIH